mmetsp:Transcript_128393/g.411539  ORF Transcript_128393/g.411539 Transcript_128393/m.411539 type:complete len:204 (-) Transcript_128393:92-703(-)
MLYVATTRRPRTLPLPAETSCSSHSFEASLLDECALDASKARCSNEGPRRLKASRPAAAAASAPPPRAFRSATTASTVAQSMESAALRRQVASPGGHRGDANPSHNGAIRSCAASCCSASSKPSNAHDSCVKATRAARCPASTKQGDGVHCQTSRENRSKPACPLSLELFTSHCQGMGVASQSGASASGTSRRSGSAVVLPAS